jgi:hypothetical protein
VDSDDNLEDYGDLPIPNWQRGRYEDDDIDVQMDSSPSSSQIRRPSSSTPASSQPQTRPTLQEQLEDMFYASPPAHQLSMDNYDAG